MKRMLLMLWTMVCLLALTACGLGVFHAQESEAASSPSEETGGAVTTEGVELTLQFSFGERTGIYSGGMKDGLPDGQGTFESRNETGTAWVYEGGWEMGHLKGQGTTTFESGYRETGWYEGDNLNGQGKLYQDDILIYEGAFTDNIPDGQGTLYSMCGEAIYSGSFAYGFIDETEEARDARLSAFKAASGEQDYGALLESAQNGGDAHTKLSGTVYYLFEPDEQGYGCSFLLEMADGNIVCVSYRLSADEVAPALGKKVMVWGISDYLYTYETETGAEASLPMVEAWDVMDISGTLV